MRKPIGLLSMVSFIVVVMLASACAAPSAPAGSAPGAPATPADQLALNIDPATYVIVEYRRSGGLGGVDEQAQLFLDGHVVQERAGQEPVTFQLSPAEQAQLTAAFDAADFYGNARQAPTPGPVPPDAFQYQIMRRGLLLQGTLNTHDGEMPAWAQPLLPLLDNLLLAPERAVAAEARAESAQAATATPGSLAILLLEFARLGPDGEDRLLLNLDRTYSLARAGQVSTGEVSAEDMVALLKLLEGAQLAERGGEYLSKPACAECSTYELSYRNLFGDYTVRGQEGALPGALQTVVDTLVTQFFEQEATAASPLPSLTDMPVSVSSAPTTTAALSPAATSAPSPTVEATLAPTPALPAPTATLVAAEYQVADLVVDLVAAGMRVAPAPGRVVKPYLSAAGVVVKIDSQPLQLFEYADETALLADVDGLAADASAVDGVPLTWPATPHFWRKGRVLALAVTADTALVEMISAVLGDPFVQGAIR